MNVFFPGRHRNMQGACRYNANGSLLETFGEQATRWTANSELVIVVAHFAFDVRWLVQSAYPVHLCGKVGDSPAALPRDPRCQTANAGQEASAYLSFIVNYWDQLPERVAFVHGHERAVHQKHNILDLLAQDPQWRQRGFTSLNRAFWNVHLPGEARYDRAKAVWPRVFARYLGEMPGELSFDCCAQFVVSRENIRRLPKQAYVDFLRYSLEPEHCVACVFETLWPLIFGSYMDQYDGDPKPRPTVPRGQLGQIFKVDSEKSWHPTAI